MKNWENWENWEKLGKSEKTGKTGKNREKKYYFTGPVSDVGQEGEHEVELLLNRRLVRGVMSYLVRWQGHTSTDDEWLRVEELAHCQEKVAKYDAAAPRRRAARWADPARRFPARCLVRGPGGDGPRRPGGALPLAGGWLGPRHRGRPQPGRRVLTRGAVRPRIRPRVGGCTLAARCGLARPGRPLGASPAHSSLVWLLFSGTTVMGLPTGGRWPGTGRRSGIRTVNGNVAWTPLGGT